jgi:uncharacterized membrane protein YfcA
MEIFGYIAAIVIGVLLGLIGGGGSILTVPVLVYLFEIVPVTATAYSLFIVGISSLVGAWSYFKKNEIDLKTAIIFGIPSIFAVYMTRDWILPALPPTFFQIGSFVVTKDLFLMILFAVFMLLASYTMLIDKNQKVETGEQEQKFPYPLILLEGTFVGVLTGLVGAGGGFLIIPALVIISKLSMKKAVGTSLLIIAAKSVLGFTGELNQTAMDWNFLLTLTGLSIVGIFVGTYLTRWIDSHRLKPAFGVFVLVMGIYILAKEIWL